MVAKEASLIDPLGSYGFGLLWGHHIKKCFASPLATNTLRERMGTLFADKARSPCRSHCFLRHYVILKRHANDVNLWKGFLNMAGCLDPT